MINLLGLTDREIKQKRRAFLLDFYKEINEYTEEMLLKMERRNLSKNELKEIQKELNHIDEMRKMFFSEIKIVKKPVRREEPKRNFLGFEFGRR